MLNLCLKTISEIRFSAIYKVNFFSLRTCSQLLQNVASLAISYLSPKQAVRLESCSQNLREVADKLRKNLMYRAWTITSLFSSSLSFQEGASYLSLLAALWSASDKNCGLSLKDKQVLEILFLQEDLCKFDVFVASTLEPESCRQHKIFKELFTVSQRGPFHSFKSKLQKLTEIQDADLIEPLSKEEKLSIKDISILIGANTAKTVLENLKASGIKKAEKMASRLEAIQALYAHPFFENLKQQCLESRKAGMIFLGDRHAMERLGQSDVSCYGAVKQLFMGRLSHMGIFVNPEEKGLHLSHIFRIANKHVVAAVRNPLAVPFSHALALDIRPLIPENLLEEQKEMTAQAFFSEFQRLAEEEHPELSLAGTKQHLKMLVLGHKTFFSQKLDSVGFSSEGTPTMCSSFVAIVFLKAVQKMNCVLEEQGIDERIPHPFGEHENLMTMDILRLIYLWKELRVIKPVPISNSLAKVIHLSGKMSLEFKYNT